MGAKSSKDAQVGGDKKADDKDDSGAFGKKKITFAGSFCLMLNNSMGPAMVVLPLMNQAAGWLTPTLTLIILFFLSTFAGTMLCEAMQHIPGNRNFDAKPRYEFATTVRHYYGQNAYLVFQIFYNISLQAFNIVAMIVSAQTVDIFIYKLSKHGFALDYKTFSFVDGCSAFSTNSSVNLQECFVKGNIFPHDQVISLGFVITMIVCIPLGYINLDANMWFQWVSLAGLFLFTSEFVVQFVLNAIPGTEWYQNVTATNGLELTPVFDLRGQPQVLGLSVLAYAYIVTIPSWVNEKKPGVNINKAIWYPAIVAVFMKVSVGLTGSWAFYLFNAHNGTAVEGSDNILNFLLAPDMPLWTQYSAYFWDITTLIPGIPVLAIMVRYNLQAGGLCGQKMAFFLGVVLPWIVTAFCYEYDVLNTICSWTGNVVSGFVNFSVPAMLYYSALKRYPFLDKLKKTPKENIKATGYGKKTTHHADFSCPSSSDNNSDTTPLLQPDRTPTLQRRDYVTVALTSETENQLTDSQPQSPAQFSTESGYRSPYPSLSNEVDSDTTPQVTSVPSNKDYSEPPVNAVPSWIPFDRIKFSLTIAVTFTVLALAYIVVQIYAEAVGDQY